MITALIIYLCAFSLLFKNIRAPLVGNKRVSPSWKGGRLMFLLLKYTLPYTVVLMMVALGGMFSERSGIINIALRALW